MECVEAARSRSDRA